jgi:hypothetical protein
VVISFFGGERANVDYVLANPTALVVRGDPPTTKRVINSLDNKQRFCSGAMTFEEMLSLDKCNEHINELEAVVSAGLPKDSVDMLIVRHTDKSRTELHFDIPEVDLLTGRQMTVYFDARDRRLGVTSEKVLS